MSLTKFPSSTGTNGGLGPINSDPSPGTVKYITVKNLGPEIAWLGIGNKSSPNDDGAYPLAPGELVSFVAKPGEQYKYGTYSPGATLWVWEA